MLLRSWLADWPARAKYLLNLVRKDRPRRRLARVPAVFESLEQRCLLTTLDLGNLGSRGLTIFGADGGDQSGYSVSSAGDVNGDGFDDMLIGADHAAGSGNAKTFSGECYVVFGGPSLPATIDLANLSIRGVKIFGAASSDFAGRSVSSAGDVNGDGFDDVLIGAPGGDGAANDQSFAGESYIVFGKATFPANIDLANLGTAGVTIFGADVNDQTGQSVSGAGDVNGDGLDDIIIGAFASSGAGNSSQYAGESYVVFGSATLPTTIALANLGSAGITIFGADADDFSGIGVSGAGDMNGDGFDDMLVGAQRADGFDETKSAAGEAYVIFGGDSLPATINLSSLGAAGITIFGADATDFAGYSVSDAGDVNGDGFDDILIGAFAGDGANNQRLGAGDSYLIFGAQNLPTLIDLSFLGTAGIVIFGVDGVDYSGQSVSSAGDVNGDGFDDILVGALNGDGAGNAASYAGESYLIFGKATLPSIIDLAELDDDGITILGIDVGDNSGHRVSSAGDVNGDGRDDVIIGARFGDGANNARENAGESYVVFASGVLDLGGPAVTWAKKQPPVTVLPQLIVAPGFNSTGITLTLSVNAIGSKKKLLDQFSLPPAGGLGTTSGPQAVNGQLTLQIALNSNVTNQQLQSFLRGITFSTKGKGLKAPTRTLDVTLSNAGGQVAKVTQTIHVSK